MMIPKGPAEFDFEIKRSRFIAQAIPVTTPEAARKLLNETKAAHSDAAHVVHSFITGKDREHQGVSDDGEPSGTAGKPVWEVLKGRGVTNLIVLVIRYYGGIKLGTGGLVKAYGDAAKGVLDALKTEELIEKRSFLLSIAYGVYELALLRISECEGEILEETFDTDVTIQGVLPAVKSDSLEEVLTDLTSGRCELMWIDGED